MARPRSDVPSERKRYGWGFWLHATGSACCWLGYDAGVSFYSSHDPVRRITYTVIANTSEGAWPMARRLTELLELGAAPAVTSGWIAPSGRRLVSWKVVPPRNRQAPSCADSIVVEELLKRWWVLSRDAIDRVPANWAGIVANGYLGAEVLENGTLRAQNAV